MYNTILTVHVLVCLLVILVVLIQSGKGAGLSNVFGGGGGGDALFSAPSGSLFIRKLTTGLAVGFFLTSLTLTYLSARRGLRTVTRGMFNQSTPIPLNKDGLPISIENLPISGGKVQTVPVPADKAGKAPPPPDAKK